VGLMGSTPDLMVELVGLMPLGSGSGSWQDRPRILIFNYGGLFLALVGQMGMI
jgi:hypothetical protein